MCGVGFSVEDLYDGSDSEEDDVSEDLSSSTASTHSLTSSNSAPIPPSIVDEKHGADSPSLEDDQKRKRITSMTVQSSPSPSTPSLTRPASQVLHNKLSEALAQRGGAGPGSPGGRGRGVGRGVGRP